MPPFRAQHRRSMPFTAAPYGRALSILSCPHVLAVLLQDSSARPRRFCLSASAVALARAVAQFSGLPPPPLRAQYRCLIPLPPRRMVAPSLFCQAVTYWQRSSGLQRMPASHLLRASAAAVARAEQSSGRFFTVRDGLAARATIFEGVDYDRFKPVPPSWHGVCTREPRPTARERARASGHK